MKICNNCQYSVEDNVKFCSICGSNSFTPVEQTSDVAETPVATVNPTEPASTIPVQNTEPIQAQTGFIPANEPVNVPVQDGYVAQPQSPVQPVQPQGAYQQQYTQQPNYQYQQPPMAAPVAPAPVNEDGLSDDNKVMAAFCYVPIISWIMYLIKPEDKGVVNCANQGFWLLLLNIGSVVLGNLVLLLKQVMSYSLWWIPRLINTGFDLFGFALWIFALIGFIKVLSSKECFKIPVVGKTSIFKVKNK
ncbi:MAG: hypothetical protein ACI37Z_09390 [Candidatus Gastranaerophilaceae bacterium]